MDLLSEHKRFPAPEYTHSFSLVHRQPYCTCDRTWYTPQFSWFSTSYCFVFISFEFVYVESSVMKIKGGTFDSPGFLALLLHLAVSFKIYLSALLLGLRCSVNFLHFTEFDKYNSKSGCDDKLGYEGYWHQKASEGKDWIQGKPANCTNTSLWHITSAFPWRN